MAACSSMTMRAPGTSATPSGSVTRNSFASLPFGSRSKAITSFWPDLRWPSEAVKQTSLVLTSDDCSVGFLMQYRVQDEAISCSCCWPFCAVPAGAPSWSCPAFGPGCWANARPPDREGERSDRQCAQRRPSLRRGRYGPIHHEKRFPGFDWRRGKRSRFAQAWLRHSGTRSSS